MNRRSNLPISTPVQAPPNVDVSRKIAPTATRLKLLLVSDDERTLLPSEDHPDSVNDAGNVSQDRQQNVEPEM